MFTVSLQRRRLRSVEPEDEIFVFRWWADLQFLIVALRRLRRGAIIVKRVPLVGSQILTAAVEEFDRALPGLAEMRNVGEHIDDYAIDNPRRHHGDVDRRQLAVGTWDGTTYSWLGHALNVDAAHDASEKLWSAIRTALKSYPRQPSPAG